MMSRALVDLLPITMLSRGIPIQRAIACGETVFKVSLREESKPLAVAVMMDHDEPEDRLTPYYLGMK